MFVAGQVLVSVGAWRLDPAAGLITAGVLLALCALAFEHGSVGSFDADSSQLP